LVLAPHDSALLAMKRDAVQAPTPRHAPKLFVLVVSKDTISRSTTDGEETARRRLVVHLQNGTILCLQTRSQAAN
jgi:hypothetical protein